MTDNYSEEVVQVKKFVIEQLLTSQKSNIEYKLCYDYLHNYKNDKYREMMTNKTGKNAIDLYKEASTFVVDTNNWIYNTLKDMSKSLRAKILNEPIAMDSFLDEINKKIKENHNGIFLFKS